LKSSRKTWSVLSALKRIFASSLYQREAHQVYVSLVEQARQPIFYEQYHVPDTLDGRFDVIVLHLFLATQGLRAQGSPEALEFARELSEVFFSDMDRSLREMGVGDTGISKRIRKMAQACYGRLQAYSEARGEAALAAALARNLYRSEEAINLPAGLLAYVQQHSAALQSDAAVQAMIEGKIAF